MKVLAVHASVHLPYDHRMLVQNLSAVVILVHRKKMIQEILVQNDKEIPHFCMDVFNLLLHAFTFTYQLILLYGLICNLPSIIRTHLSFSIFDHLLCCFFPQAFNNASVPASVQATFPYIFAVSKFLQVYIYIYHDCYRLPLFIGRFLEIIMWSVYCSLEHLILLEL